MFAKTLADGLFWAAVGWLSAEITESDWQISAIFAAGFAAYIAMLPAASHVTEQNAEKTLKLVAAISAAPFVFISVLWATGAVNAWTLTAASIMQGCCVASLTFTRWTSYSRMTLERSRVTFFALDTIQYEAAKMLAPAIGGYLIAAGGPIWPILAAIAASAAAAMFVASVRFPMFYNSAAEQKHAKWSNAIREMHRKGDSREIFWAGCILWAASAPSLYMLAAIAEAWNAEPQWYGWMGAAIGAGGLFGGVLLAANWHKKHDLAWIAVWSFGLSAAGNAGVALSPDIFLLCVSLFVCGLAPSAGFSVVLSAMMNCHPDWNGKTSSVWSAAIFGVCVPGVLLTAGILSSAVNLQTAFLLTAAFSAAAAVKLVRSRKKKRKQMLQDMYSSMREKSNRDYRDGFVIGFIVGNVIYTERDSRSMFFALAKAVEKHSDANTAAALSGDLIAEISDSDLEAFMTLRDRWNMHRKNIGEEEMDITIVTLDEKWRRSA